MSEGTQTTPTIEKPPVHPSGITPTVGRIVLFHKPDNYRGERPAIITGVNDDGTIDVQVFYRSREPHLDRRHTEALLLLGAGKAPVTDSASEPYCGPWCSWMPYQAGQAAKTEQLEKKLADASAKA